MADLTKYTHLKWSEGMWRLSDGTPLNELYLGEAGNSAYRPSEQVQALREGDQVLITSNKYENGIVIPSNLKLSGFYNDWNDKTLGEVMDEGTVYDYTLLEEAKKC